MDVKSCLVAFLGRVEYSDALQLQMRVCDAKKQGLADDVLLLLEHPPTITLGRNGKWGNLLASDAALAAKGVRKFEVDRGGDITFHGPGQLVGYPLMKLERGERDVHRFMRNLEDSLINVLAGYGIEAGRQGKLTGVWTKQGKIGAMGVHISRWITRHGFALNVNTELSYFDLIVPCGIAGKGVASMQSILGHALDLHEVAERYAREFAVAFDRTVLWASQDDLQKKMQCHARENPVA